MKIIHKMMVAPGAAILFLIVLGALALVSLRQQNRRMLDLDEVTFSGFKRVSAQTVALAEVHTGIYSKMGIMASLNEAAVKQVIKTAERDIDPIGAEFARMNATPAEAVGVFRLAEGEVGATPPSAPPRTPSAIR